MKPKKKRFFVVHKRYENFIPRKSRLELHVIRGAQKPSHISHWDYWVEVLVLLLFIGVFGTLSVGYIPSTINDPNASSEAVALVVLLIQFTCFIMVICLISLSKAVEKTYWWRKHRRLNHESELLIGEIIDVDKSFQPSGGNQEYTFTYRVLPPDDEWIEGTQNGTSSRPSHWPQVGLSVRVLYVNDDLMMVL